MSTCTERLQAAILLLLSQRIHTETLPAGMSIRYLLTTQHPQALSQREVAKITTASLVFPRNFTLFFPGALPYTSKVRNQARFSNQCSDPCTRTGCLQGGHHPHHQHPSAQVRPPQERPPAWGRAGSTPSPVLCVFPSDIAPSSTATTKNPLRLLSTAAETPFMEKSSTSWAGLPSPGQLLE